MAITRDAEAYIRRVAHNVCEYADLHGYTRDKNEDEIISDLEFVFECECPEEVLYLYEYIGYDSGVVMNMIDGIYTEIKRIHNLRLQ